jgi:hypothetical protein
VERAIAEYCAGKENGGAGIQICDPPRASRELILREARPFPIPNS